MLKFQTNEVPEGLSDYYEDSGNGVFTLKVEGVVSASEIEGHKAKIKEFRDSNIALKKQVEELARFETMFKSGEFSAEKLNLKIEEQALIKASEMKAAYEAQVAELNEKQARTNSKLEQIVLNNAVSAAALKNGVAESALEDVYARAKTVFQVIEGELSAIDGVLDAKGKPLTIENWMEGLAEKAPHLFSASRGAGASKPVRPVAAETKKSAVDLISAGLARRR